MPAPRLLVTASVAAAVLTGCVVPLPGGSKGGDAAEVTARSGAFTIEVPDGFADTDIAGHPETIEIAQARDGEDEQIIASRFDGSDGAEREGLYAVTSTVTQHGLICHPLDDTLGGGKAWSCTGEHNGDELEKAFVTAPGDGESALLLVQGPRGQVQDQARDIVDSLEWR